VGLTRGTSRAHLVRATLEAIAYESTDLLRCFERDTREKTPQLQVDGGATANDFLMQFQADVMGVPVRRPKVLETTALGTAYLAGLAKGFWKDRRQIARNWQEDRFFEPELGAEKRDALYAGWLRAVERSRNWVTS
jgi:glycerol kinase